MKKTVKTVALFMLLGTLAVSCQKENIVEPNATEAQACTVRAVSYTIDGVEHLTVLHCDEEWDAFLSWMLALSKEGRQVYFRNLNATGTTAQTKEVITYTTTNENDAKTWIRKKADEGYAVTMYFDDDLKAWVCIATK
ncbi:MAG: hypothetical protein II945_07160 [Bacteroidales bacterium]|nr:hypothetical protein [Bacteroidales bacterium]